MRRTTAAIRLRTASRRETPLGAAARGLLAGLGASLMLSALSRVLPGMSNAPQGRRDGGRSKHPLLPQDPFDPEQVAGWQSRAQSPAAHQSALAAGSIEPSSGSVAGTTPASALALPQAPGPEGLAEQFAFKVASGIFGRDISRALGPAGMATHLTYGSLWGVLFGLIQGSFRRRPVPFGVLYGLTVWLAGPVTLVPAMKLARRPWQESPLRAGMMVVGHVAYGVAAAAAFEALEEAA